MIGRVGVEIVGVGWCFERVCPLLKEGIWEGGVLRGVGLLIPR